ncbi:MAG: histidine--tRNA ligase [Eubacteriales bacterium]
MGINAPKGTKDILPSQSYKWQFVEKTFKEITARYGFKEIRTPIFEYTELFKRGVGDTTDIVEKQMYSFDDYGGRNITLKPEGTAPVVRAFVENKLYADVLPFKTFYMIPCFRYEKPQAGRLREFHQFGVEIFGTMDMLADAEVIATAVDFLNELKINDLELRINSIGCPLCREAYKESLMSFLKDKYEDLCDTCKGRYFKNPMRILDCKSVECQKLVVGAPRMLDYICEECSTAFDDLKKNLDLMKIDYIVDSGIVRGLDYYTKTAFEIVSNNIGAQGTVCGGGRYDNLIEQIGGPATPGVGFGLGIERLLLLIDQNDEIAPKSPAPDVYIATMGESAKEYGITLSKELRDLDISLELDLMSRNIKSQFKYADKIQTVFTIVIGDEEIENNKLIIKNMSNFEQIVVSREDLVSKLMELLGRN